MASPGAGSYLDEDSQARQHAKTDSIGEQVARFGDLAFDPVIQALDDSNLYVREAAAKALIRMRPLKATPVLIAIIANADKPHDLRLNVMRALGSIRDRRAIDPLLSVFQEGRNWQERRTAAEALESLGWMPETNDKRILKAIALERWDEITSDPQAIEPLCRASATRGHGSSSTQVYHDVLRDLLRRTAEKASDAALNSVINLDVAMPSKLSKERLVLTDDLKEMARGELERRRKRPAPS